jgi:hypothetical protein
MVDVSEVKDSDNRRVSILFIRQVFDLFSSLCVSVNYVTYVSPHVVCQIIASIRGEPSFQTYARVEKLTSSDS